MVNVSKCKHTSEFDERNTHLLKKHREKAYTFAWTSCTWPALGEVAKVPSMQKTASNIFWSAALIQTVNFRNYIYLGMLNVACHFNTFKIYLLSAETLVDVITPMVRVVFVFRNDSARTMALTTVPSSTALVSQASIFRLAIQSKLVST